MGRRVPADRVGPIEVFPGRVIVSASEEGLGVRRARQVRGQADYTFSSEEGRELITDLAEQLGLEQRRGTAERIGLYFAVVGLVGAAITLVVNLILWLTGYYG